jgi:ribose transport system substrate-binding protein
MKRKIFLALIVLVLGSLVFAGAQAEQEAEDSREHVAVIVKGTHSDFWQYVLVGASNYGVEHADKVRVTTHGPDNDTDIEAQLAILEDVISSRPSGIVIASTSSDAPVSAIERAMDLGIPVVVIDTKVNTEKVTTFLATDNRYAGKLVADKLVEGLKKAGKPLEGKVGFISAYPGIASLIDRQEGFLEQMAKIAPDMTILPIRYCGVDIAAGMGPIEDEITAHPDMVGFFGDCNIVGSSFARVVRERSMEGQIVAVSFDSDNEEIAALKDGIIYSVVVQDPYNMGYMGVDVVLRALEGEEFPAYIDTGVVAVTKENMEDPEIKGLLNPLLRKK